MEPGFGDIFIQNTHYDTFTAMNQGEPHGDAYLVHAGDTQLD